MLALLLLVVCFHGLVRGEELEASGQEEVPASSQEDLQARVAAQLEVLGVPQEDISSLPVDSRETRESSCPGVTEDVITYSLHMTDGLQPDTVLINQVVLNDNSRTTWAASVHDKPWISGNATVRPYLNCLAWDSEQLLEVVREMVVPPSSLPYNFSLPLASLPSTSLEGEVGQPREVDSLVYGGEVKDGFFLEAGSHDSETNSDSLYWEVEHGWSGLLVEPHPLAHTFGLSRQRKASSIQTCLSTEPAATIMHFDPHGSVRNATTREAMAGLVNDAITEGEHQTFEMQCLPLYTVLLAMGNPTVHHFSLDIEGAEFPVLKTVPWHLVREQALSEWVTGQYTTMQFSAVQSIALYCSAVQSRTVQCGAV